MTGRRAPAGRACAVIGAALAALAVSGAALAALAVSGAALAAAPGGATAAPPIKSEYLVLTRSGGQGVTVFEDISLEAAPAKAWRFPLPIGAKAVHARGKAFTLAGGRLTEAAGTATASVVFKLSAPVGSAFVQTTDVAVGHVVVLAGPGVYPGVGTGLSLKSSTKIHNQTFSVFSGGAKGPGDALHFSVSVGQPGVPWADAMAVLLALWLAFGAAVGVIGVRRLVQAA